MASRSRPSRLCLVNIEEKRERKTPEGVSIWITPSRALWESQKHLPLHIIVSHIASSFGELFFFFNSWRWKGPRDQSVSYYKPRGNSLHSFRAWCTANTCCLAWKMTYLSHLFGGRVLQEYVHMLRGFFKIHPACWALQSVIPQIKLYEKTKTNKTDNRMKVNKTCSLFNFSCSWKNFFSQCHGSEPLFWFCFGWHANVLLDFCFRTKFNWSSLKPGLDLGSDHRSFEPI